MLETLPEVEVLRHVHLLEDVHQALLLRWLVHFVVEGNRDDIRVLTVVDIMSSNESNNRSL